MMEVRLTDDYLSLAGKDYVLSEVTDSLANLSATQIVSFFNGIEVKLPRVLNSAALRGALNQKVVEAKTLSLSDEMMYRLRFYPDFSEYQLQSFYKLVYKPEMDILYKKSLFTLILLNSVLLNVTDEHVLQMLELAPEPFEEFNKFEEIIMPIFYDFNKDFDGIRKDVLTTSLRKSATASDIRDMGAKYSIAIPKRLKRDEMQKLIEEGLRKQHKLTEEMKAKLDKLPIINLQRVAKQNDIKVSVDLKKEDLIAYLLNEVDKAKFETKPRLKYELDLGDGFVFDLAYVMEVEEIEEFVNEQNEEESVVVEQPKEELPVEEKVEETQVEEVKEEPVVEAQVEEVIEEVKEEPVVEETVVQEEVKEEPVVEETVVQEEVKEEPKEVVREVVKESGFDYEKLTRCIVDVIRELTPILTRPKDVTPAPIINIYNNEVKDDKDEQAKEELAPLKRYGYHNFDEQVSPNYDAEVAKTMALADVRNYAKPVHVIIHKPEEVKPDVVEEVKPSPEVQEEVSPVEETKVEVSPDVVVVSKKKQKLTNKQRIENMKAARARKLAKKGKLPETPETLAAVEVSEENPAQTTNAAGTRFVIPAQVMPNNAVDGIPANIVIMTEGGQSQYVPTGTKEDSLSPRDSKRALRKADKDAKKLEKKQEAVARQQFAKNVANMRRSIKEGVAYEMDDKFFEQSMRIKEYNLKTREDMREKAQESRRKVGSVVKWILAIILILLIVYAVTVGVVAYMVNNNQLEAWNDSNSFLHKIPFMDDLVNWLTNLL